MSRARNVSFGRRILPAAVLAAGAGGVLGRIQPMASSASAASSHPSTAPAPTTAPVATEVTAPPATPAPTPAGGAAAPQQPAPLPEPTTTTTLAAMPAGTCGAPVDGPVAETRWGPVQVAAAFTPEGTLCDVVVLQYPSDHRKSQRINQRALPMLHDLAIEAQGTDFQTVSGATVTTRGYKASLQAILDGQ